MHPHKYLAFTSYLFRLLMHLEVRTGGGFPLNNSNANCTWTRNTKFLQFKNANQIFCLSSSSTNEFMLFNTYHLFLLILVPKIYILNLIYDT